MQELNCFKKNRFQKFFTKTKQLILASQSKKKTLTEGAVKLGAG